MFSDVFPCVFPLFDRVSVKCGFCLLPDFFCLAEKGFFWTELC